MPVLCVRKQAYSALAYRVNTFRLIFLFFEYFLQHFNRTILKSVLC